MSISLLQLVASAQIIGPSGASGCGSDSCDTGLPGSEATGGQLHSLLQITLAIFAVIAVLIIIIAGMNFVYASGDPQKVAKARSTILYALVGLITAISAELVVTFVVGQF